MTEEDKVWEELERGVSYPSKKIESTEPDELLSLLGKKYISFAIAYHELTKMANSIKINEKDKTSCLSFATNVKEVTKDMDIFFDRLGYYFYRLGEIRKSFGSFSHFEKLSSDEKIRYFKEWKPEDEIKEELPKEQNANSRDRSEI